MWGKRPLSLHRPPTKFCGHWCARGVTWDRQPSVGQEYLLWTGLVSHSLKISFTSEPRSPAPVAIKHWPQVQGCTELCFRIRILGVPRWVGGASHRQWESRSVTHGRWTGGVLTHGMWAGWALRNRQAMVGKTLPLPVVSRLQELWGKGPSLVYSGKTGLLTYGQWAGKASYSQAVSGKGQGEPAREVLTDTGGLS